MIGDTTFGGNRRLRRAALLVLILFIGSALSISTLDAKTKQRQSAQTRQEKPDSETAQLQAPEQAPEKNPVVEEKTAEKGEAVLKRDYDEKEFGPQYEEESVVWSVFKMIFVIGIFLGGLYYFFRFVTKKAGIHILGQEVAKVIAVVPLGGNKFLQMVDMAGKIMVLGVTDANISVVSEIRERDEVDRIRLLASKAMPVAQEQGFAEHLMGQLGKAVGYILQKREQSIMGNRASREKGTTGGAVQGDADFGVDVRYLKNQKRRLQNLNDLDDE